MKKSIRGFTIVELLIVIVVIAILASISVVAYTGIQGRARDSQRKSDLNTIVKLLEMYHAENGGYPNCNDSTYQPGAGGQGGVVGSCLAPALIPRYTNSLPSDPVNSGPRQYYYAVGYKKTGEGSYSYTQDDNYMIAATLDSSSVPVFGGWGVTPSAFNYLVGSSN